MCGGKFEKKVVTEKKTILITGASKGLGLELAKQFANANWNVIAGVRNLINIKNDIFSKNINFIKLDVNNARDIRSLVNATRKQFIDVVLHNAGIYYDRDFGETLKKESIQMYLTNSLSPLIITEKLFGNILKSKEKLIILITGRMGSFANDTGGGKYGYRASKTAANMMVKTLSIDLKVYGIKVMAIHPGWIKTEMGGLNAKVNVENSAKGIKNIILKSSEYSTGSFYTFEGLPLQW